jgi:hypothetical protein
MQIRFAVKSWILELYDVQYDVLLISQLHLFEIFWELWAYRRPTPQRQPHSAHKPYAPSFTGFKTTSRNVQRSGLLYRLVTK